MPVNFATAQFYMLGGASGHALAPHAKARGFHLAAHQFDDGRFIQAELLFDGFERGAVFPRHFDDARDVFVGELSGHSGLTDAASADRITKKWVLRTACLLGFKINSR